MTFQKYAIALLVLVLAAFSWRYRNSELIQGLLNPPQHKPSRIEFDNGTVRQYDNTPAAKKKSGAAPLPIGALRKCQARGQAGVEISYTNHPCPPGSKELPLTGGALTVIEGQAAPPAAAPRPLPNAGAQGAGGLGRVAEPTLREKAVERAVHQ